MKKGKAISILFWLGFSVCLVFAGCKERFEPDLPSINTGYLVVEGVINRGAG